MCLQEPSVIIKPKQKRNSRYGWQDAIMNMVTPYVIYEDAQMIVCHKPSGFAVQSARFGTMDMESALKNYLAEKQPGKIPYLGLVHRLDQPVEGVIVFAKTSAAAANLSQQITKGEMEKYYLAVSSHIPEKKEGILEDVLLKDGKNHISKIVKPGTAGGKKAKLAYKLLREEEHRGLFEIHLFTGRHHQIRVQMAGAGMPLLGDRKYNPDECDSECKHVGLCAYRLRFRHPKTGKHMEFKISPKNPVFAGLLAEK